ncbi:MAG: carbon storage regulator [Polyangiaceae bacterium]|nr:carbon storage regulator [Myxococcales bacterium]MCB9587279.1 carbon storage regulator [Polyangiaceae bacterium]MCB9605924.1 carbon storage regulator [Polyangiaceae bacterium]
MLIIARRVGQRIVLGDDIEIHVTALSRKVVKIGVVAPRGRAVLRGEVHDSILEANQASLDGSLEVAESVGGKVKPAALPVTVIRRAPKGPEARDEG